MAEQLWIDIPDFIRKRTNCQHCHGSGTVETDNNGPIGDCPVCAGKGFYVQRQITPPAEQERKG